MSNDPSAFDEIDRELWLEKVTKELKGKPYSDLQWYINPRIQMDPLLSKNDSQVYPIKIPKTCFFGEKISVNDTVEANKKILSALLQGINAPQLYINQKIDLNHLLKDVELSFIDLSIVAANEEVRLHLAQQIGSIPHSPIILNNSWSRTKFNKWLVSENKIQGIPTHNDEDVDLSLTELFHCIISDLNTISEDEIEAALNDLIIEINISTSFYLAIAKLRATRIMFDFLINTLNRSLKIYPTIIATCDTQKWTEDANNNLILCTTQAMSSILGGADIVNIMTPTSTIEHQNMYHRITRNIHQILNVESNIHRWEDPIKGSYYIETLSFKIAQSAWRRLQQKMADE